MIEGPCHGSVQSGFVDKGLKQFEPTVSWLVHVGQDRIDNPDDRVSHIVPGPRFWLGMDSPDRLEK